MAYEGPGLQGRASARMDKPRIRSRSAPRCPLVCPPGSSGLHLRDHVNFPGSLNHSCELLW